VAEDERRGSREQEQRLQELITTLSRLSTELLTLVNSRQDQEGEHDRFFYDLPETATVAGWGAAGGAALQDNGWSYLAASASPQLRASRAPTPCGAVSHQSLLLSASMGATAAGAPANPLMSLEPSFENQRPAAGGGGVPVRLNLLGRVFRVSWGLLGRLPPDSRLGRLAQCHSLAEVLTLCDRYEAATNEFFFNHRHQAGHVWQIRM
jgi:hypothetical protein